MAIIRFYADPTAEPEVTEVESLGHWLIERYGGGQLPSGLRIFDGPMCVARDATERLAADPQQAMLPDATWEVCIVPEGIPTWVQLVIAVVVGVAASVLLAPEIPSNVNRRQQSANNGFSNRVNSERVNQRIPDIRGTVRSVPDLWAVPYSKFVRNRELETTYMCISAGRVETSDIRDGDTLLANIVDANYNQYGPGTSPNSGEPEKIIGERITDRLYEVSRSNEVAGDGTIKAPNDGEASSLTYTIYPTGQVVLSGEGVDDVDLRDVVNVGGFVNLSDFYNFIYFDSGGPSGEDRYTRDDLGGNYEATEVNKEDLTLDVSAVPEWASIDPGGYQVRVYAYQEVADPTLWYLLMPDPEETAVRVNFSPNLVGLSEIIQGPFDVTGADELWINIVAQNGLYKDNGQRIFRFDVDFKFIIYELDEDDQRTGASSIYDITLKSNGDDQAAATFEFLMPYERGEVTLQRLTETDKEFEGNVIDQCKWRDLYLVNDVDQDEFGNVTTIHVQTKATDSALRVKERKINMVATRKVKEYLGNGVFSEDESLVSDRFADVLMSMAFDPYFGRRTATTVDIDGIFEIQQQVLDYFGFDDSIRVGYTFDSTELTFEESWNLIAKAVWCQGVRYGSILSVFFERQQDDDSALFSHRHKWPTTDVRSRSFRPDKNFDGVEVTYRDLTKDEEAVIDLPADGSATNPRRIELPGVSDERSATLHAWREFNKLHYARVNHSWDALAIGRMFVPGQRVAAVNNTLSGTFDGRITGQFGTRIQISQPVTLQADVSYSIVMVGRFGEIESMGVSQGGGEYELVLERIPNIEIFTGFLEDQTAFWVAADNDAAASSVLLQEVDPSDKDKVTMRSINYDDRYYEKDQMFG